MTVGSITAAPATTNTPTTATKKAVGAASLDYHAFMQLLIAQLKNQDPTKPMDSGQFMTQLATFSQVEQSVTMNAKLDSLLTSSALAQADSIIGRTVTSPDGTTSGEVLSVKITSDGPLAALKNGGELLLGSGVVVS